MTITNEPTEAAPDVSDLPRGWRWVKFGDVVRQVKVDVKPEKSGLEHYVAGEHMETDDLHIRRWGVIGDGYLGPAFHRKFIKGQVLYGSRRTYLRKVAVAEFDGICANTTFVLEPTDDQLLPDLLPFIMQTDAFNEHSVKQSKGSVNPYVNFSDLAWYEFALPPIDEQRRIAELLWAADGTTLRLAHALERSQDLEITLVESFLREGMPSLHNGWQNTEVGRIPESWRCLSVADLASFGPRNGLSPKTNAGGEGFPTLSISAIRGGTVIADGNIKYSTISSETARQYRLNSDDVLIVRGNGNRHLVGKCGIVTHVPEGCFYPDLLMKVVFDERLILPQFACIEWNSDSCHSRLISKAKSTNGIWKVNGKDVREHLLAVPPLQEQTSFLQTAQPVLDATRQIRQHLANANALKLSLTNSLLACGSEVLVDVQ